MTNERLTASDLDGLAAKGCGNATCTKPRDVVFLAPARQFSSGVIVTCISASGVMELRCHHCGAFVASVLVGNGRMH